MKHFALTALLATLVFRSVPTAAQELLKDGGFEGLSTSGISLSYGVNGAWTWTQSPAYVDPIGIRTLTAPKGAHTGTYDVFFNTNTPSTSSLYQTVNIPPGVAVTLSFWTKIATDESSSAAGAYDTLTITVTDQAGSVAPFTGVLSNKDATQFYTQYDYDFWVKYTYDISTFKGKTVRLQFDSVEDAGSNRTTTFNLDDVSIFASAGAPINTYVLPSSAHSSGANGAFYTTDLSISNRGATPANIGLKFIGNNQDGRNAATMIRTLAAGQSTTYTDILSSVFGVSSGWGGIIVTSDSNSLKILGQTSTPPPDGKGSFGQSVPGMTTPDFAASYNPPLSLISIRQDSDFRTNLVLTNVSDVTAAVMVQVLDSNGAGVTMIPVTLLPESTTQLNAFAPSGTKDGVALISTTTAGAQVAAYAAVIDNVTNDPRTILP